MKDFLKRFFAFYRNLAQSIVDHFAERAARIEERRAIEHARKVELAKAYEPLLSTAIMGFVAVLSKVAEIEAAKRKFPPGGIAKPGNSEGGEWVVDRMPGGMVYYAGKIISEEDYREICDTERIRKAAEQWRKFDDKPPQP